MVEAKNLMPAPKKRTKTQVMASLDRLARDVCYLRTNRTCEKCKEVSGPQVQWAHIEGRRKKGQLLRWSQNNCLALCAGPFSNNCHHWFDNNHAAAMKWLEENYPDKHAWLIEEIDGKPRSAHLFTEGIGALEELEQELKEEKKKWKN